MRIRSTLTILALAFTAACGDDVQEGLVIGALIDQTGPNAETSWVQAARLAAAQMNAALEAEGSQMRFALELDDSENNSAKSQARALDLVNVRGAKALIADTAEVTEAVGRLVYANQIEVPVQCSNCESRDFLNPSTPNQGDPQLQQVRNDPRGMFFRTSMSTDPLAYVALDILRRGQSAGLGGFDRNADNFVKLEIYGSNDADGRAAVESIYQAALVQLAPIITGDIATTRFGAEIILHDASVGPANVNYAADIAEMRDTDIAGVRPQPDTHSADYIIVATSAQYASSFREVYAAFLGQVLPPAIYFPTYRQSTTIAQLGASANTTIGVSTPVVASGEAGDTFTEDYRAAYGFDPNYKDAAYYDNATTLMLAAVIGGGSNGTSTSVASSAIRAAMPGTSAAGGTRVIPGVDGLRAAVRNIRAGAAINYDGASGPMDYDANRSVRNELIQFIGRNGQFQNFEPRYNCVQQDNDTCGITPYAISP